MKKLLAATLTILLATAPPLLSAKEDIQQLADQTDALYRTGAGAQDGAYTSLALSMLGWGLGLAAGIAILAAVLHQSSSSHNHDHCH